jgi:hypothetical protein
LPTWPFDSVAPVAWAGVTPATFCTLSRTSGGGKSGCSRPGAFTEVESYLLATGVHADVPLIIEVDDLLETFEDTIVHVSLHETWVGSFIRLVHTWVLEEPAELGDVARNVVEEPGPIRRRIGIRT